MKTLATLAGAAALAVTTAATPAQAGPHNLLLGGAIGLAAGVVVGGAIASAATRAPAYGYAGDAYGYAPDAYGYGSAAPVARSGSPNCTTTTKYDWKGQPYAWKDCW